MESRTDRGEFCKWVAQVSMEFAGQVFDEIVEQGQGNKVDVWMKTHAGEFARKLLGRALSERAKHLGISGPCRKCHALVAFRQQRPFVLHTVLPGREVEGRLLYGQCPSCRQGVSPLLQEVGADSEGFSDALQELALRAGVIEPFAAASEELLEHFAGVRVSPDKLHRLVALAGADAPVFLQQVPPAPSAVPVLAAAATAAALLPLYVGIDGGMLFVEKRWQEVKLACLFRGEDRALVSKDRGALVCRQTVAVRGPPEALAKLLAARSLVVGADSRRVVVLGDGAPWIWNLAEEIFPGCTQILDWYHADEHVSAVARVLHGQGTEEAARWRAVQLERLAHDEVSLVIEALRFLPIASLSATQQEMVSELVGYLDRNRHRMSYGTFKAAGFHIGSGCVESAVGHVLQQRMKRSGMRWQPIGADAMIALRSIFRSHGAWSEFWDWRKAA
jgi:hypothetical protein